MPWKRKWQPTPVFLLGESHGQRSLAGCSPWVHKSRTHLVTKPPPPPMPEPNCGFREGVFFPLAADRVQSNTTQPLPNTPGWEPAAGSLGWSSEGLRSEEGPPGHCRLSQGLKLPGSRAGLRESSLWRQRSLVRGHV